MAFAIARIAKQKGGTVGSSSLHNGRERETPNADPSKASENRELIGAGGSTPQRVREVIEEHGGKPRSDSVEAVEVLLTASPEWWRDDDDLIDEKKVDQFSEKAKKFLLNRKHGGICVKATLHLDEHSPHIHGIMVPIDPKGKLNCKHFFGKRQNLRDWQTAFAKEMAPLGLERGREGSRATHIQVQQFYKAIDREHHFRIDYDRLPDPPRVRVTKESAQRYKEEFVEAMLKQIEEPLRTQLHQAMLARDTNNRLKETKERLARSKEETSRERLRVQELSEANQQLQHQVLEAQTQAQQIIERCERAEARVQDVPLHDTMKLLGYKPVAGRQRGTVNFVNEAKEQIVAVTQSCVFDENGTIIARTSLALVQEIMKREGREITREAALGWLADRCGEKLAKGAYLAEREQAADELLEARRKERSRGQVQINRNEALARPEMERVREQGRDDRPNHDRGNSGFTR